MTLLRPTLFMTLLLTLLTGIIYPLLTTGLAQALFTAQANGSLLQREGITVGSRLIGQNFTHTGDFWGRPSATSETPYNAMASGGSNLAISNPQLDNNIAARAAYLRQNNPQSPAAIPADLLTASASGLDPHISPAAAYYQAPRVAAARHLTEKEVNALIAGQIINSKPGFIGQPVVNVLALNLALDKLAPRR